MICECRNCEQTSKCEHRHDLGNCHRILGCPPNAWDGDKLSSAKECDQPGCLVLHKTPPTDRVEEKINSLVENTYRSGIFAQEWRDDLKKQLRELVQLVRQERK